MSTRDENIKKLEELATKVLELKNKYRQRRPIVVEFCGCPKAGKTSSINALNIFLKRNGFKTEVLTEKASICPISDKQCSTFNVWTCTSMINEINEKIDLANHPSSHIDIILCDRGIFDALCWFNWLNKQAKMRDDEYDVLNKFAMLNRWQRNIDIVYVFLADPKISIDREFSNLLTNKRGSIMNEDVLEGYKKSVVETYHQYKNDFRATEQIDTSNTNQCDIGYIVTEKTLQVLEDMLMERIGYFEKEKVNLKNGILEYSDNILKEYLNYGLREEIEENSNYIQPIAIAVLINKEKDAVFCVKKTDVSTPKDSPESGKHLLYVGGHMRREDDTTECKNFLDVLRNALERELFEELGKTFAVKKDPEFTIYMPTNEKSAKHIAIGWVIECENNSKFKLDKYELIQKKGSSKSGTFIKFMDVTNNDVELEEWSKGILQYVFKNYLTEIQLDKLKSTKNTQLNLF